MKKTLLGGSGVLAAAVILIQAGFYVSPAHPQAGIEFAIPLPGDSCGQSQPTGVIVEMQDHEGALVFTDTVMVATDAVEARWSPPEMTGPFQIRAIAFIIGPDGIWRLSRFRDPDTCTVLAGDAWSSWSNIFDPAPRPGQTGTPVAQAVVK